MARSPRIVPLLFVFASVLAVGCDSATAPDEVTLEPPAPAFLIGGSPLIIDIIDPATHEIGVTVEVTRGLTIPKPNSVFKLRTSLSFTPGSVGSVDPKDNPVTRAKDEGIRGSGTVSLEVCVQIPDEVWAKLVAADQQDGTGNPTATATVQLILTDGAGKEHILDTKTDTSSIDTNGDG